MSSSLFLHTTIFLIAGVVNIFIAIFVIIYSRKKLNQLVIAYALFSLAAAGFNIPQALGAIAPNAEISHFIFMFNLSDIFIGIFLTHWFLSLIKKDKEQSRALFIVYFSGIALFITSLFFPNLFLQTPIPKMYLPFYYEPGPLYYLMFYWFILVAIYYFHQMFKAYRSETDPVEKKRFKYVLWIMLYAVSAGSASFALVFDIKLDPVIGGFGSFYTIPLAYIIIKYELFDIRILAKRAFTYAIIIIFLGLSIIAINFFGNYYSNIIPNFPQWLAPSIIALLVIVAGIFIWYKARENDVAKNEFISVIMHKFRTPLTQAKWATEILANDKNLLSIEGQQALVMVEKAHSSIMELTNVLVSLNDSDNRSYNYKFINFDLLTVINSLIDEYGPRYYHKKISINLDTLKDENYTVYGDPEKIKFALDILINNALIYTPDGGKVIISLLNTNKKVTFKITDSGIGIPKESIAFIFSKFYRGRNAQNASTEGTGIGLYLAHEIFKRGGGSLTFASSGEGKGSTFIANLPIIS